MSPPFVSSQATTLNSSPSDWVVNFTPPVQATTPVSILHWFTPLATRGPQQPFETSIESHAISYASGERPSLNVRTNFQPFARHMRITGEQA